jgi:hypothetical protein
MGRLLVLCPVASYWRLFSWRYRSTSCGVSHQSRPCFTACSLPFAICRRSVTGASPSSSAASLIVTARAVLAS